MINKSYSIILLFRYSVFRVLQTPQLLHCLCPAHYLYFHMIYYGFQLCTLLDHPATITYLLVLTTTNRINCCTVCVLLMIFTTVRLVCKLFAYVITLSTIISTWVIILIFHMIKYSDSFFRNCTCSNRNKMHKLTTYVHTHLVSCIVPSDFCSFPSFWLFHLSCSSSYHLILFLYTCTNTF